MVPLMEGAMLSKVAATSLAVLLLAVPGHADPVADFYRNKTITISVGFTVGGGYDLYARLLGRHMGRHIPGNPTIVVQNMPGAGSQKATQFIYSIAPKDGTHIGSVSRGMITEPLLNNAPFDATKFSWLGTITNESSVCGSWHTSKVKTWEDMFAREFTMGGSATGADPDQFALILRNVLGAKVRLVTGYPGGNEINLAMERGEVDGRCGWSWTSLKSQKAEWLRDKKAYMLVQFGTAKHADLPHVPLASDHAKTDEQRQIMRVLTVGQAVGRPFFAPPGIPEDRKAALRKAFDATMKDKLFLEEAAKLDMEVSPASADEVDKLLADVYRTPKPVLEKALAATLK
jgi:tripartite-type tricarboxylate transporter receptor subunit TctC